MLIGKESVINLLDNLLRVLLRLGSLFSVVCHESVTPSEEAYLIFTTLEEIHREFHLLRVPSTFDLYS